MNLLPYFNQRKQHWIDTINRAQQYLTPYSYMVEGRLTRLVGLTIEAQGCQVNVGGRCLIVSPSNQKMEAEVVGFSGTRSYLMPIENMQGAVLGARVIPTKDNHKLPVGEELLGRVVDGAGKPLDKKGLVQTTEYRDLEGRSINPFERMPIEAPLDVGVKAINALLSIGTGQRMGLFAGKRCG